MPKLYPKKHFFVFLASVFVTVFVGYFAWSAVIGVGGNFVNKILNYTEKISADFFSASVLQKEPQIGDIISDVNFVFDDNVDEVPTEEVIQTPLIIEESRQDLLDDIQEKLDIIQSQVNELVVEQNQNDQADKLEEDLKDQDKQEEDKIVENLLTYPEILISEVKVSPIDQRFIKLYNPNDSAVDLAGWYLQRKTATSDSWSSLVSSTKFEGKIILPNSYFLISRTDNFVDIFLGDLTVSENNFLALKNPNGEISSTFYTPAESPPPASPSGSGGGGIGANCKNADDILVSEFQVEDETVNDDYVELYNPNDEAVCLGSWSIQKASISGKISRVKNFDSVASIPGTGYFLIVNSKANSELLSLANMTSSSLELSSEFAGGNTIYLVKKHDIVADDNDPDIIDEVGYGMAKNYIGLPALMPNEKNRSTGRIWDEMPKEYKNTDNNSDDFEIDAPTPKAQNIKWVPEDITAPVIILLGDPEITINVGDTYTDVGATASDDIDGDITANIAVVNPVDANTVGDYIITYNVSDTAGNNAVEVTRFVHIIAIPPVSDDATVTSEIYTVSSLTDGAGTITDIPFGTSRATFESVLVKNQLDQTWDDSGTADPVATGDILVVTAQDGTTQAVYIITVNEVVDTTPPNIISYTLNGSAQNVSFNPNISESIAIVITASEPVKWTSAKIYKVDDPSVYKNKNPAGDGTVTGTMSWDGTLTKPTVGLISTGVYAISVHIVDSAGNDVAGLVLSPYTITIDNSLSDG